VSIPEKLSLATKLPRCESCWF